VNQQLLGMALAALAAAPGARTDPDPDSDGDGLSDFAELHKYGTDPRSADSDGDGVPDSDWDERREFNYSVRAVMHVMAPFDVESMNDDYQDVRVLERTDDLLEFEVVVYPFNTVAEAIEPREDWGEQPAAMRRYLDPGPCSNWDEGMRAELLLELEEAGIALEEFDDASAATAVAEHLMERSKSEDCFTTFAVSFDDAGRPSVSPFQKGSVAGSLVNSGRSLEEQWERELFGRGMFENRVHGSCTSSAIYLTAGLRAAGIPTRTVVCTPVIDANDSREVAWIDRLSHHGLRAMLRRAARELRGSWASHTFNEVFVGGRWRRQNYANLGQNVLDPGGLGLMVHVHTFADHSEAGLVGWGDRQAHPQHGSLFGGPNPYSCVSLSDRFGVHASVPNEIIGPAEMRITSVFWYDDPRRSVETTLFDGGRTSNYLVVEFDRGEASGREALEFWKELPQDYVLRAAGRNDVVARGIPKFWGKECVFLLRIEPEELEGMPVGVEYAVAWSGPRDERDGRRWSVPRGATVAR